MPLVVVPCVDGLAGIRVEDGSFSVAWRAQGPFLEAPIFAYGWLWSVARGNSELWQIDPSDGTVHEKYPLGGQVVAHFLTPSASSGMLLIPAGQQLMAMAAG